MFLSVDSLSAFLLEQEEIKINKAIMYVECLIAIMHNGCEHEQCGFGANQLSLTTNLVG